MNQIINIDLNKNSDLSDEKIEKNKISPKKVFNTQFYLSIIAIFIIISLFTYYKFSLNKKENLSHSLKSNYSISQLYAKNSNNSSISNPSFIIGMIEIPSLSVSYPIFSYLDDELLKISPCKFLGEMPPASSNLCIAGHNYDNNKFFSNINLLKNGDEILIYNQIGEKFVYYVFNQYEVNDNDLSPIKEDYQGGHELTLITCNNLNQRRIVVKAEKE